MTHGQPVPQPPDADRKPAGERAERPPTIPSQDLFHGAREVLIDHSGEIYRLRLTRNGKLILHK